MTDTPEINADLVKEIFRRIDYLYRKISTHWEHGNSFWDLWKKDKDIQDARIELLLERVKNLEAAVLPDLTADLERVSKLIGPDQDPATIRPMDFREEPLVRIHPEGPPWRRKKASEEPASS